MKSKRMLSCALLILGISTVARAEEGDLWATCTGDHGLTLKVVEVHMPFAKIVFENQKNAQPIFVSREVLSHDLMKYTGEGATIVIHGQGKVSVTTKLKGEFYQGSESGSAPVFVACSGLDLAEIER